MVGRNRCNEKMIFLLNAVISLDVLIILSRRSWCSSNSSRNVPKIESIFVEGSSIVAAAFAGGVSVVSVVVLTTGLPSQERFVAVMSRHEVKRREAT